MSFLAGFSDMLVTIQGLRLIMSRGISDFAKTAKDMGGSAEKASREIKDARGRSLETLSAREIESATASGSILEREDEGLHKTRPPSVEKPEWILKKRYPAAYAAEKLYETDKAVLKGPPSPADVTAGRAPVGNFKALLPGATITPPPAPPIGASPFAATAGGSGAASGGSAVATGGSAAAAGAGLGAMGPLVAVGGVILLGRAAVAAVDALRGFAKETSDAMKIMGQFSMGSAMESAVQDFERIKMAWRRANAAEPFSSAAIRSRTELEQARQPLQQLGDTLAATATILANRLEAQLTEVVSNTFGIKQINSWLRYLMTKLGIVQGANQQTHIFQQGIANLRQANGARGLGENLFRPGDTGQPMLPPGNQAAAPPLRPTGGGQGAPPPQAPPKAPAAAGAGARIGAKLGQAIANPSGFLGGLVGDALFGGQKQPAEPPAAPKPPKPPAFKPPKWPEMNDLP